MFHICYEKNCLNADNDREYVKNVFNAIIEIKSIEQHCINRFQA